MGVVSEWLSMMNSSHFPLNYHSNTQQRFTKFIFGQLHQNVLEQECYILIYP